MALPFATCLVLTGIHVYLGIHVIERRVVFVDLALAQIAALGSVWGVLLGWSLESDSWEIQSIALGFSIIGAGIFALTRTRTERIPHEAVIGIIYAVALASTVLASVQLAHGAEEVRGLLSGSILWVTKEKVMWTTLLYVVVGLIHWIFRKPFFELSRLTSRGAEADGTELDLKSRMWDFLFYVTFGFVVTSSVSIGGVLLVFSYLVIPAVASMMFVTTIRARLLFGWAAGTVMSAVGVFISYQNDLPSGPTIVVCLGAFLALGTLVHQLRHTSSPLRLLVRTLLLTSVPVGFLILTWTTKPTVHDSLDHRLASSIATERLQAIQSVLEDPSLEFEASPFLPDLLVDSNPAVRRCAFELVVKRPDPEYLVLVASYLSEPDDLWREEAVTVMRQVGGAFCVDALHTAALVEADEFLMAEMADALMELEDLRGGGILLELMDSAEMKLVREDAWASLQRHAKIDMNFDSAVSAENNDSELAAIRRRWDSLTGE